MRHAPLLQRTETQTFPAGQIRVEGSPGVRDAFAAELFRLSPPHLRRLSLRGSANLRRLVLSPLGSCPALKALDLGSCPSLEYLLVQSASLKSLDVSGCPTLAKALVQCPALAALAADGCCGLERVTIWSSALTDLDLSGAFCLPDLLGGFQQLKLQSYPTGKPCCMGGAPQPALLPPYSIAVQPPPAPCASPPLRRRARK
jgi:hypothetical protein